jgi:hypothetical protein
MNLKKALKHDVEVAGKTIPTMILVGLFLVGGGSAALLTNFGTVSGEADVTQAVEVTGEPTTVSYDQVVAGTTTVDTFDVENNNEETSVDYTIDLQTSTNPSDGNMNGVDTQILDIGAERDSDTEVATGPGSLVDTEVSYDSSSDEVQIEATGIDNYGSNEGVIIAVDTDNDGVYDFHIDAISSGEQPDYWENSDDGTDGYNGESFNYDQANDESNGDDDGADAESEHDGVFYTQPDTSLREKDSFVLTINADKLGSEFAFNVDDSADFAKPAAYEGDDSDPDAVQVALGEEVSEGTVQTVSADDTRNYALVNEWAINLDPTYDYNVTAQITPDYDQEGQENPEN